MLCVLHQERSKVPSETCLHSSVGKQTGTSVLTVQHQTALQLPGQGGPRLEESHTNSSCGPFLQLTTSWKEGLLKEVRDFLVLWGLGWFAGFIFFGEEWWQMLVIVFVYFPPNQEVLVKFISLVSWFLFRYFQTHFWWQSEGTGSEPNMKIMTPAQFFYCLLTFRRGRSEAGAMINTISFNASRGEEAKA